MSGVIQFWKDRIHGPAVPVSVDDPLPVYLGSAPAGTNLGFVAERFISTPAIALTRPANVTGYSINDAVTDTGGAATTVTVSDVNDAPVTIEAIRVDTADTGFGTAAGLFECWVYRGAIVPAADNAAFTNSHSNLVGRFTGTWIANTDGSYVILTAVEGSRRIALPLSGAKTFNLIFKTIVAVTPSANSTVLNVKIEGFQGRA